MDKIIMSDETGRLYNILDLQPRDVSVEIVANRLAQINRCGGSLRHPYSVAQHSVFVSHMCEGIWSLAALWHDAAEAFLVDVPTPIKREVPGYRLMEHVIEARLRELGYPLAYLDSASAAAVHVADKRAWQEEYRHLKCGLHSIYEQHMREMDWRQARGLFLARHDELVARNGAELGRRQI
jgi:hypothetical protein